MLEMVNRGWVPYGFGHFVPDQEKLARLLGETAIYEVTQQQGINYVRRIEPG